MFTGVEIAEAAAGHPGLEASAPYDSGKELTISWQASESFCHWVTCVS